MFKGIMHDTVSLQLVLTIIIRHWCNNYIINYMENILYFILQILISLISMSIIILLCWWIWQVLDFDTLSVFYSHILESMHGSKLSESSYSHKVYFCSLIFKVCLVWIQNPKFQISFPPISVIVFELLWLYLTPNV